MAKTVVLISGGNRGIGLETVKALLESINASYHIYMGSRDESKGSTIAKTLPTAGENTVQAIQLDITSPESVSAAVSRVKAEQGRLDVLINNAGVNDETIPDLKVKMLTMYDINVVSVARMMDSFQDLLLVQPSEGKIQKRIINVTSSMGSIKERYDPAASTYLQPYTAYRCTKAAQNMLTACTAYDLKDKGVKVTAFNPGWAATELGGLDPEQLRQWGAIDPRVSGLNCRDVVEGKRDDVNPLDGMVSIEGEVIKW
ncbi:NAD(P)-binding protein [Xylariaceae sp. FL0255]|nr:NAD(P)-binding protein [Xylariaceae sp. FL0255]